jgi:ABC-type glutathione transport system ATPase component
MYDFLKDTVESLGLSALTITHDLKVAAFLADGGSILNKGYVVWTGQTCDIVTCENDFVEFFVTPSNIVFEG